jgi:hypothetical protein
MLIGIAALNPVFCCVDVPVSCCPIPGFFPGVTAGFTPSLVSCCPIPGFFTGVIGFRLTLVSD